MTLTKNHFHNIDMDGHHSAKEVKGTPYWVFFDLINEAASLYLWESVKCGGDPEYTGPSIMPPNVPRQV